ncbi:hypothetical protein PR048_027312 [Dryococelus australis]|uniref:Uncharacterized protein n=1 Tax=Dryococelus australis TaxID=614101 RepID=A0ABQ9GF41_9NEOP|nr:hypothetical protein PR048_027312 [Dryococelus australis]
MEQCWTGSWVGRAGVLARSWICSQHRASENERMVQKGVAVRIVHACDAKNHSGICGAEGYSTACDVVDYSGPCDAKDRSGACDGKGYSGICGAKGYSAAYDVEGYSGACDDEDRSGACDAKGYSSICGAKGYSAAYDVEGYSGACDDEDHSGACDAKGYSGICSAKCYSAAYDVEGYSGTCIYSQFKIRCCHPRETVALILKQTSIHSCGSALGVKGEGPSCSRDIPKIVGSSPGCVSQSFGNELYNGGWRGGDRSLKTRSLTRAGVHGLSISPQLHSGEGWSWDYREDGVVGLGQSIAESPAKQQNHKSVRFVFKSKEIPNKCCPSIHAHTPQRVDIEVLGSDEGEARYGAASKWKVGRWGILEEARQLAASSATIPTHESPGRDPTRNEARFAQLCRLLRIQRRWGDGLRSSHKDLARPARGQLSGFRTSPRAKRSEKTSTPRDLPFGAPRMYRAPRFSRRVLFTPIQCLVVGPEFTSPTTVDAGFARSLLAPYIQRQPCPPTHTPSTLCSSANGCVLFLPLPTGQTTLFHNSVALNPERSGPRHTRLPAPLARRKRNFAGACSRR